MSQIHDAARPGKGDGAQQQCNGQVADGLGDSRDLCREAGNQRRP